MAAETAKRLLSFEDYLDFTEDSGKRYELIDGELTAMTPPTVRHLTIAKWLEKCFDQEIQRLDLPWVCMREAGVRTSLRKSRLIDVCVVAADQAEALMDRSAVFESPPLLAVEIVSKDSVSRDYRYERSEYAAVEIPEYWVVDPLENKVTVLRLEEGLYEDSEFFGHQTVASPTFHELAITVRRILSADHG
jgi:Uma2 family endonuclease